MSHDLPLSYPFVKVLAVYILPIPEDLDEYYELCFEPADSIETIPQNIRDVYEALSVEQKKSFVSDSVVINGEKWRFSTGVDKDGTIRWDCLLEKTDPQEIHCIAQKYQDLVGKTVPSDTFDGKYMFYDQKKKIYTLSLYSCVLAEIKLEGSPRDVVEKCPKCLHSLPTPLFYPYIRVMMVEKLPMPTYFINENCRECLEYDDIPESIREIYDKLPEEKKRHFVSEPYPVGNKKEIWRYLTYPDDEEKTIVWDKALDDTERGQRIYREHLNTVQKYQDLLGKIVPVESLPDVLHLHYSKKKKIFTLKYLTPPAGSVSVSSEVKLAKIVLEGRWEKD